MNLSISKMTKIIMFYVQSKSLEEMFRTVLGPRASHLYSFSVFFLLIGAISIFIIMMGVQTNDVYLAYNGFTTKKEMEANSIHFRILGLCFSGLCGLSLFIRNLKMLSYVSVIKIVVIILVLLLSVSYAPNEYFRRRERDPSSGRIRTFKEEFPLYPTLLGFMKAMGSWQTAYLFHMGVSDMYFSLQNRSYARWSRVSRLSVALIATINVCYAMTGYLATADSLHPDKDAVDLCSQGNLFLSYYQTDYAEDKGKWMLLMAGRGTIVLILMASYPLLFYFLKEYTIQIARSLIPQMLASQSTQSINIIFTVMLWLLITGWSMITGDPFKVTDLVGSVVGTIVVFLMPALCYIQIHGGFVYVFSLGLCGQKGRNENGGNMTHGVRVPSQSMTVIESEKEMVEKGECAGGKTTVLGMLSAQFVVYLSIAFVLIGLFITLLQMGKGVDVVWRDTLYEYFNKDPNKGK